MRGNVRVACLVFFCFLVIGIAAGAATGLALSSDGTPDPTIVDVEIEDDEITLGESTSITVQARNDGGTAGPYSTITLSFPDLDSSGDGEHVSIAAKSISHGYEEIAASGDDIWNANENEIVADYVLAEAGTSESFGDDEWPAGETRNLEIDVTPQETGAFDVYVRNTMHDGSTTITDPNFATTTDQQGYTVEHHEIDVTDGGSGSTTEDVGVDHLLVGLEDQDGQCAPDDKPLFVTDPNGETDYITWDDRNTNSCLHEFTEDNSDISLTEGEYHIEVPQTGTTNYWGYKAVEVTETNTWFTLQRGGAYVTDMNIRSVETPEDSIFGLSEEIEIDLGMHRHRNGDTATIETYVYETDENRPSTPRETETVALSEGTVGPVNIETPAPMEPNEYTVDVVVQTELSSGTELRTDEQSTTIDIVEFDPPVIDSMTPSDAEFERVADDSIEFEVDGSSSVVSAGDLDYEWYVDGEQVSLGSSFEMNPHQFDPGTHTVEVLVEDGIDSTDNVRQKWVVDVIHPPSFEDGPEKELTAGDTHTLTVDAIDPNGDDDLLHFEWEIDNETETGDSISFTPNTVGDKTVYITATNIDGVSETKAYPITVTDEEPDIENVELLESTVTAGDTVAVEATAADPLDRGIALEYEWHLEDETHAGSTATVTPREVGGQELTLTVTNEFGSTTSETQTITVQNVPPEVARINPADDAVNVPLEDEQTFSVEVTNEDIDPVSVEFLVDDHTEKQETERSNTSTMRFDHTFDEPGEYDVHIDATDSHGETETTSWEVLAGEPPEITDAEPGHSSLSVTSGEGATFSVEATHTADLDLTYDWYIDDSHAGSGTSFEPSFTEGGTYGVRVVVTDEMGFEATEEWTVDVDSFRVPPQIEEHSEQTVVAVDEETTIVEAVVSNPDANDRPVSVEIDTRLPSGVTASHLGNVDTGGQGQYTAQETLEPGQSETVRLGVDVRDDSLADTTESISYEIRYHPEDVPDDLIIVNETSTVLEFYESTDEMLANGDANETDEDDGDDGADDSVPGFGVVAGILAVVGAVCCLRGRSIDS